MNILKWVAVIVIAFFVGYFSRSPEPVVAPEVIADCLRLDAFKEVQSALQEGQERFERLKAAKAESKASSSRMDEQEKIAEQPVPDIYRQKIPENAIPLAGTGIDPKDYPSKSESNITDEEIDNLVAAPFNESLKRTIGPLREKYKSFAEATEQSDWDSNTQNRMTDALLGNQYSKFIELESLICRADYCEIRGRESKSGVFGLIMSEMMLQDWWKMGHSQWTNGIDSNAFYALITKAPEMQGQQ